MDKRNPAQIVNSTNIRSKKSGLMFYSARLSMFSGKVEIAMLEKSLAYVCEYVPFSPGTGYSPKHPAVVAANPKAQVPVLIDGSLALYDSTQILEYLDDAYSPPLWPQAPSERARARQWEHWSDEVLFPPALKLLDRTLDKNARGDAAAVVQARLDWFDAQLDGREYIAEDFSFADIAIFMAEFFAVLFGLVRRKRENLFAWRARMLARPSVRTVVDPMARYAEELGIGTAVRLIDIEGASHA